MIEPDVLHTPAAGGMVIRGGVLRAGGYGIGLVLGALTAVFLLRALGTDDFGRYATVGALLGIVSAVTDAGLTAVGARELSLRPRGREREHLLGTLVALRVVLTTLGVLVAAGFAYVVGYDGVVVFGTLLAGVGVLLVNTQATMMLPLSVELRIGTVTGFEVARQALTLAGIAALAVAGASLMPFFAVQALVGLLLLVATPFVMRTLHGLVPVLDVASARALLLEAAPLALALAMSVVYLRLMLLLVSLISSEETTGIYAAAFRVFEMFLGLTALLGVALPVLSVAGVHDRERLAYAVQRMAEIAVLLAAGIALVTLYLAEPLIVLLGGDEYAQAGPVLQIQVWAILGVFVGQVAVLALVALRRQIAIAVANGIALVVLLALGLALVPAYGAKGAASGAVAAEAVLAVTLFLLLRRADRSVVPSWAFGWRVAVALGVGLAPLLVPGLSRWVAGAVAALVFVLAAFLVRAVPNEIVTALRAGRGGHPS
jgi:O-antigen/teichoic acid export membrane protein